MSINKNSAADQRAVQQYTDHFTPKAVTVRIEHQISKMLELMCLTSFILNMILDEIFFWSWIWSVFKMDMQMENLLGVL